MRHYENFAFGKERYNDQSCAFEISNKFTGQILDEETGLYYYNARYYDPEIGRFIQADTVVPTAADPQNLNRYAYCNNNPLNCTDPSGQVIDLVTAIIVVVVAVVVNVAIAAATGGNIALAAAAGVVGGVLGVAGAFLGSMVLAPAIGEIAGAAVGGAVAGAAGGAATAAMSGGDIGMGALTGAVGGAIGGATGARTQNWGTTGSALAARAAVSVCSGALAGGVTAAIAGGNVWQGMAMGAAGAAVAFAASVAISGNGDEVAEQVKADNPANGGADTKTSGLPMSSYSDDAPIIQVKHANDYDQFGGAGGGGGGAGGSRGATGRGIPRGGTSGGYKAAGRNYPMDYQTKNTRSLTIDFKSEGEARAFARTYLGKRPVALPDNKLRSQSGAWQYRARPGDVSQRHIHLERLDPQTGEVTHNYHLRWPEGASR